MSAVRILGVAPAQQPGPFSPVRREKRGGGRTAAGPTSNTGQKYLAAPIVDFCTVVVPAGALKKTRCRDYRELLDHIFNAGSSVAMGAILDRAWQFYPQSATLIDETGSVCGKVGFALDGSICFSLTGQACQHVTRWDRAKEVLQDLDAHLSRLDIAVDDLKGEAFDVHLFDDAWSRGEFDSGGRPPGSQFIDDQGTGKGCTLYIGQKGHKQLCIYEKGKQLGDPLSTHVRCELRLYAKRLDLPLDALTNLAKYFGGAYPLLAQFVIGEAEKLLVKQLQINPSAKAMVRFLRNQAGTALQLVFDALGDEATEFLISQIARPGRPGRFKKTTGHLPSLIRGQLLIDQEHIECA